MRIVLIYFIINYLYDGTNAEEVNTLMNLVIEGSKRIESNRCDLKIQNGVASYRTYENNTWLNHQYVYQKKEREVNPYGI